MTEIEYVIANFAERFAAFREKRIVLHGSRNYAEAIIKNFGNTFQFVGIMSLDKIDEEYFHGLKVIEEEALSASDVNLIILTERVKYAVEAFRSIRRVCKKNDIAIYNMYGVDEFRVHHEAENTVRLTLEKAKTLCNSYDMIAFEVIDTLFYSPHISNMSVRVLFYELIAFLREQEKTIRFSLRKSFPADIQIDALKKFGLLLNGQELIYREGEDLSFRKLRTSNPTKKILYFGAGLANEFILPRCYGIDTCRFIGINDFHDVISATGTPEKKFLFTPDFKTKVEKKILVNDYISFDIFDTLLIRKTLYPRDVFLLAEKKAIMAGYDVQGFASARERAEEDQPYCDFDQIYAWLGDHFGWQDEMIQRMQEIEFETERSVLAPREEVVDLLNFAKMAGKHIILTSDMYFPESYLIRVLADNGVSEYEQILVSCRAKKSKHSGLYRELLNACNHSNRILHIGDNPETDGIDCKACGIDSIILPSALEMARERGWKDSICSAYSFTERCLLGLIISQIFRDPFQNQFFSGDSVESESWRFGYSVIGPLTVGYLLWLINKLNNHSFDGVLFLARDGWLSYQIYRCFQEQFQWPRSIYYYASRHAAFLCYADAEKRTDQIIENAIADGLSVTDLLHVVYQISGDKLCPRIENEDASEYIERHMEPICKNAYLAREGYLRYSVDQGMSFGQTYAVVDYFASGTIQRNLSYFLPFNFKGFYLGKYSSVSSTDDEIEYFLQKKDSKLLQHYLELEAFLSSSEPSLNKISVQGKPVFNEELRTKQDLQKLEIVLSAAESYGKEFFSLFYQEGCEVSPDVIENVYVAEEHSAIQLAVFNDLFKSAIRKSEVTDNNEHS